MTTVVSGLVAIAGLALAPVTAGSTLVLASVSMALTISATTTAVVSSVLEVPADLVSWYYRSDYSEIEQQEAGEIFAYSDNLAEFLSESLQAFKDFDKYIEQEKALLPREVVEILLLLKHSWVMLTTTRHTVELPKKIDIFKSFVKRAKSITRTMANGQMATKPLPVALFDSINDIKIIAASSPSTSHNAIKVLSNALDRRALNLAAQGFEVPYYKLSESKIAWTTIIRAGSKTAAAFSVVGSALSLVGGIESIMKGVANIKGSGILSDRIRRRVYDLDARVTQVMSLYNILTQEEGWSKDTRRQLKRPKLLSGLEVHTCWQTDAQTDSPISIEIKSGSSVCRTNLLDTIGHNDLEVNQWDVYDTEEVLGQCAKFLLDNADDLSVRMSNGGSGAHCVDIVNLQVDYLDRAFYACSKEEGVWSDDYSESEWIHCDKAPHISKIVVHTCLSDYSGTDSPVRIALNSGESFCFTDILDNNGNDLSRGHESVYRQDILDNCKDLKIVNDSLKVSLIHQGYDALCIGNLFIHAATEDNSKTRMFRCHIPHQETIEYDTSDFFDCVPFKPNKVSAIHGMKPYICSLTHSGSSTGFDYGVAIEVCSGSKCCKTNYLDVLYYDELTTGSSLTYHQPGAMGECHGFDIDRGQNLTYSLVNTNSDAICIEGLDIFSMQSFSLHPFVHCPAPEEHLWAEEETKGPYPCQSFGATKISQIEMQVCEHMYSGTDSSLRVQVCRGLNFTDCCSTGTLNRDDGLSSNDFVVFPHKILGECERFQIGDDYVDASVINEGRDGICLSLFNLRLFSGSILKCSVPLDEESYWIDNGQLDFRCQGFLLDAEHHKN